MKSKLFGLIGLMLVSSTALADHDHRSLSTDAAIGGGLGGAVGGLLGAELGGRDGAIVGSGVGAILGTSMTTRDYYQPRRYHRVHYDDHDYYKRKHHYQPRRYHGYRDDDRHHYKRDYRHHGKHHYRSARGFCPPGHAKKGWCH